MDIDIFTQIRLQFNNFTKAEKKVGEFVLNNPKDVLYMSITDLAEKCNVGDTSVFRFCKTLNLKGYQDFKMMLAQGLTSDTEEAQPLSDKISQDDSTLDVAKKVLHTNLNALNETFDLIKTDDIDEAVKLMLKAKRIVFFGVGTSMVTAMEATNKFMRITPKVEFINDSHLQSMRAALLTPDDVAIAISYSGSTKDTIEVVDIAKQRGAKIICITRFIKSPLTAHSDITLLCGANEGPLQGGSLSAKLSQLYLLDLLYAEYFKHSYDNSKLNKELTSEAVSEKLY